MISVPGRAFRSLAAAILSAALLTCGGTLAFAQNSSEHALRVKSPFAGDVWRADVSADESYVSVSSAYASISTWALDVPGVPNIARLPVRNEEHKRAHAVALHPSGELVAYSAPPVIAESIPISFQAGQSQGKYLWGDKIVSADRRTSCESADERIAWSSRS